MKISITIITTMLSITLGISQYIIEVFDTSNSPISANEIFTVKFIDDAMWIGTWNKGLCHVKDDVWTILKSDSIQTANDNITDIRKDIHGNIWVVGYASFHGSSVVRYDGHSWHVFTPFNDTDTQVSGISEDRNGNLWFSSYGSGIYYFDLANESWTHITPLNSGMTNWSIRCIEIDQENRKWIGHLYDGYDLLEDSTWTNYFGLIEASIESIAFSDSGSIWLGTAEYGVIVQNEYVFDTLNSPLPSNDIQDIVIDSKDQVWIGTDKGLIMHKEGEWVTFDGTILEGTRIRDITLENDSSIWVSTWGKGLIHLKSTLVSSINEIVENIIQVYPNPFLDELNLSIPDGITIDKLELFSPTGMQIPVQYLKDSHLINFIDLPQGVYFLRIYSKSNSYTIPIVKTNVL